MEVPVYCLRYCGVRQEGLFAWSVGGLRAFKLGQEVTTSNYTEVVRALESNQFELVSTVVPEAEKSAPDPDPVEDEAPAPSTAKGPTPSTSLKKRNN